MTGSACSLIVAFATLFVLMAPPASHAEIELEWVVVAGAGNACDPLPETSSFPAGCFGGVSERYRIGQYEVTNAEYVEFLNAIAASDPAYLYSGFMDLAEDPYFGGILRSGAPGTYSYTVIPGQEDLPVNWVSFWSATRFANWLHNGQPTGAQDTSTTEDGAYTLTAEGLANNTIQRNPGARFFIPSDDEWYKAAYYDVDAEIYYDYPTGSDTRPACLNPPGPAPNSASCFYHPNAVGSFTSSASPNGTFDQSGNLFEWTEARSGFEDLDRTFRGGAYDDGNASVNSFWQSLQPDQYGPRLGFRVAASLSATPVPSLGATGVAILLVLLGMVGFASGSRSRTFGRTSTSTRPPNLGVSGFFRG